MIKTDITESTFSRKFSSTHELSILHGMDSFAFMITDEQRRLQVLRDYGFGGGPAERRQEELEGLFTADEYLSLPYRKTRVGLATDRQTLIPNRLFNPSGKEAYLEQLVPKSEDLDIRADSLERLSVQNVYAFPRPLLDFYRNRLPDVRIIHCSSAFLKVYPSLLSGRGKSPLFAHVWPRRLQLTYFSGSDLQFINTFECLSAKDFLYFTMLAFDQLALDPLDIPLVISGQILEDSEVYRMLARYVRQVEMVGEPVAVQTGPAFGHLRAHLYFDLFCLADCG